MINLLRVLICFHQRWQSSLLSISSPSVILQFFFNGQDSEEACCCCERESSALVVSIYSIVWYGIDRRIYLNLFKSTRSAAWG